MSTSSWEESRSPSFGPDQLLDYLFQELEKPKRVSLLKLAAEHYETTGRKFTIAIDYSIWQFQSKAALIGGGHDPVLRTLYYRLLRLVKLGIHACFVYDGPGRPKFKRNRTIEASALSFQTQSEKELIALFNFDVVQAPGEAEAQCAAMQQQGLVDAVLTEDGDALMFGCTVMLSNWSSSRPGSKIPTHVKVYKRTDEVDCKVLSKQDLVLVALLSGGDYRPQGVPGCGIKLAIEAARAGFGRDLATAVRDGPEAVGLWRERLQHEMVTNECSQFSRRHPAVRIPLDFPDQTLYAQYSNPMVSNEVLLPDHRKESIDLLRIAEFARKHFGRNFSSSNDFNHLLDALITDNLLCGMSLDGDRDLHPGGLQFLKILNQAARSEDDGYSSYRVLVDATKCRLLCNGILVAQQRLPSKVQASFAEQGRPGELAARDDFDSAIDKSNTTELITRTWIPSHYMREGRPALVQNFQKGQEDNQVPTQKGKQRKAIAAQRSISNNRSIKEFFPIAKTTSRGIASAQKIGTQVRPATVSDHDLVEIQHEDARRIVGHDTGEQSLLFDTDSTIVETVLINTKVNHGSKREASHKISRGRQESRNINSKMSKVLCDDKRHVVLRPSLTGSWAFREDLIDHELSRLPLAFDSVLCLSA